MNNIRRKKRVALIGLLHIEKIIYKWCTIFTIWSKILRNYIIYSVISILFMISFPCTKYIFYMFGPWKRDFVSLHQMYRSIYLLHGNEIINNIWKHRPSKYLHFRHAQIVYSKTNIPSDKLFHSIYAKKHFRIINTVQIWNNLTYFSTEKEDQVENILFVQA